MTIRPGLLPNSKLVALSHNTILLLTVETAQVLIGIVATAVDIGRLLNLWPVLLALEVAVILFIVPSSLLVGWR